MKKIKITYLNNLSNFIYPVISILALTMCAFNANESTLALVLIVLSILLICKTIYNRGLFILFSVIGLFNISIALNEYIFLTNRLTFTGVADNSDVMLTSIKIMCLFMSTLLLFIKKPIQEKTLPFVDNNTLFFIFGILEISLCVLRILTYSSFVGKLTEYSSIVFLFLCYFSGNKKNNKRTIILLLILYLVSSVAKVFIFHLSTGRSAFIQSFFVVFVYFYVDKISFKKLVIILTSIVLLMMVLVSFRGGIRAEAEGTLLSRFFRTVFLNDTAYFSYAASTTIVATKFYHTSVSLRISSFFQFLLSQIIGSGSSIVSLSNLTDFAKNYYFSYGGGIVPFHFFFWLGWSGVFLLGIFISFLLNRLYSSKKDLSSLIYVMIIATVFRWYLYNPTLLIRGSIILVFIGYKLLRPFFRSNKMTTN